MSQKCENGFDSFDVSTFPSANQAVTSSVGACRNGSVTVSIIICTRNRADSLELTLESISRLVVPDGWTVELLVVDNGSTDHTRQVVDRARFPTALIRYLAETTVGLSHARNRGIKDARGEVLLWVDDDIRVPPHWLKYMCQPLLDNLSDAAAGGVIFPENNSRGLELLPDPKLAGWYASTFGINRLSPERMVGANMAFHRRVLEKVPRFDIEMGPGPSAFGFGDETLFSWQLKEAGYRIKGIFDVCVEHHFDLSRLTKASLLDAARKMGWTDAYIEYNWAHHAPRFVGLKLGLFVVWKAWLLFHTRVFGHSRYVISSKALHAERKIAYYRQLIIQRRGPPKYALRGLVPK